MFSFFQGHESDSASSVADFAQERAPLPRQKDQNKSLLDKLTQEKLDSKGKPGNKRNDLSSGAPPPSTVKVFHPTSPPVSSFFLSNYNDINILSFRRNPTLHIYHDIYFLHSFSHVRVSRSQPMLGGHPSSLTELHAQKHQVNFATTHPFFSSCPAFHARVCLEPELLSLLLFFFIDEILLFSSPSLKFPVLAPADASSEFSLFEALRETIYSEVATLISQNESRPHFLIELFHELQLLNTDYLRQRALFSLQVRV